MKVAASPQIYNGRCPHFARQSPVTSHQSLVTLIYENVRYPAGVFACIFHFKSLGRLWYTKCEYDPLALRIMGLWIDFVHSGGRTAFPSSSLYTIICGMGIKSHAAFHGYVPHLHVSLLASMR